LSHLLEHLPPLIFDSTRVASPAIAGYGYQILQSVDAWLDLSDGEMLFLEGAEDIDVYRQGDIETIQVKHTAAEVTLASEPVVAAIGNFWRHCTNNKDRNLRLRYLTTLEVKAERGDPFCGIPGVTLWEQTRHDKNPESIARLKKFLFGLSGLPDPLRTFIQNATEAELLAKLISPTTWQTAAPDRDSLLAEIEFKLVKLGKGRPVPPPAAASVDAVEALFWEVFQVATREKDRALDRARLLKAFDGATGVWVPVGALWSKPRGESEAGGADAPPKTDPKSSLSWLNLVVPVISGAIVWWIADMHPLKLLAVSAGLIVAIGFLLFQRYSEILSYGFDKPGSYRFRLYNRFRAILSEGGLFRWNFFHGMKSFLQTLERFFLDGNKTSSALSRRTFGLEEPFPLWTAPAFDRCLLIAAIYPLTSMIFFWSVTGQVDQAQRVLKLPGKLEPWQQGFIFGILVGEIIAIWNVIRRGSWYSATWAVSGGALAMAAVVATTRNINVALVFAAAGLAAGGVGVLLGATRVQFTGSVSGAAALSGVLLGTIAFGYFGEQYGLLGAMAGGAVALIVMGGLTAYSGKIFSTDKQGPILIADLIVMMLICLIAARFLPLFQTTWGKVGPMLMFLGFLPLVNAPFDWTSVGLTRALLHRGLERKGWWPLIYALIDATCAVVLIACLALTLVVGVKIFNRVGAPVLELAPIFKGLKEKPASSELWWVYGMLLFTLIPSTINLMIGGASLMCGMPGLASYLFRKVPKDRAPDPAERTALALAWTSQVVGGALLGVAVQIGLVYLAYGVVLPAVGYGLLTMCEMALDTLTRLIG
jgi:hypothetical protein